MKLTRRQRGRGGLELAEEAVHLLRMNAAAALPAYYLGSLPFILGLLYFWADMSRSALAVQHLPGGSLGLALLFLWMKFWQAISVNCLRARISADAPPRWTVRRVLRVFLIQTAIQPSAVIFLPLALALAALPLPWVYAFYQNVTALTEGESGQIRKTFQRASRQAFLWPGQNHIIVLVLAGFALCVFVNLASILQLLPYLLKMLLGIESVYTQSPMSMLNTTFLAAVCAFTYLCVDPIVKTVYLLRCFYGESLDSGEDLKAELKQFAAPARPAIAALILLVMLACAVPARAADHAPATASAKAAVPDAVPASDLDHAINDVVHESKYTWRMPREKIVKEESDSQEGALSRFLRRVLHWTKEKLKAALMWIGKWLEKFFQRHSRPDDDSSKTSFSWITGLQALYFLLLSAVVCVLVIFIFRVWQGRRCRIAPVKSEALPRAPNLTDENVGADQLPEDGWLTMGRELLGRGELRLALRAFYFASLTHLAARNLITIAKFKSNSDYERELGRRGHSLPDLLSLFGENVSVFDRSWYGLHEVNPALVREFLAKVERMKAAG